MLLLLAAAKACQAGQTDAEDRQRQRFGYATALLSPESADRTPAKRLVASVGGEIETARIQDMPAVEECRAVDGDFRAGAGVLRIDSATGAAKCQIAVPGAGDVISVAGVEVVLCGLG